MKFLDAIRRRKQEAAATAFQQYAALITKAANADGELSPADTATLDKLAAELGRGIDTLEADVVAIRNVRRYERISGGLEEATTAHARCKGERVAHQAETLRLDEAHRALMAQRESRLDELNEREQAAAANSKQILSAAHTLSLLRARYWRILGLAAQPDVIYYGEKTTIEKMRKLIGEWHRLAEGPAARPRQLDEHALPDLSLVGGAEVHEEKAPEVRLTRMVQSQKDGQPVATIEEVR